MRGSCFSEHPHLPVHSCMLQASACAQCTEVDSSVSKHDILHVEKNMGVFHRKHRGEPPRTHTRPECIHPQQQLRGLGQVLLVPVHVENRAADGEIAVQTCLMSCLNGCFLWILQHKVLLCTTCKARKTFQHSLTTYPFSLSHASVIVPTCSLSPLYISFSQAVKS